MVDSRDMIAVVMSLFETVELGFAEVPRLTLIASVLILFGLGLRRSLLSLAGVSVIFAHYIAAKIAEFL